MIIKNRRVGLSIGALVAVLAVATPALAASHFGGAGGGGGGHVSGGGGGGGHVSGGGGHMSPGHASAGFASGGHGYSGGRAGGYAGHSYGYAGGGRGFQGGTHVAPSTHYGYGGSGGNWGGGWHGGYGGGWHGGYGGGWHGGNWGGGYWHGGFWPGAYYGFGFSWFLPVLPLAYATYWWDGLPYYYANNVYYTWNPTYDGYVVTDPPPVADSAGAPAGSSAPPSADQIYMYPKNGQTDAQLATDRTECQQWAGSQAGGGGRADDYRRAMIACAEARGYSAQ